jgi:hypothetical protein
MANSSLIRQPLPTPYVDRSRLLLRLQERFGTNSEGDNNFKVQVNIYTPIVLFQFTKSPSPATIESLDRICAGNPHGRKTFATPKKFQLMTKIVRNTGTLWFLTEKMLHNSVTSEMQGSPNLAARALLQHVAQRCQRGNSPQTSRHQRVIIRNALFQFPQHPEHIKALCR